MKTKYSFIAFAILLSSAVTAQEKPQMNFPHCATDEAMEQVYQKYPDTKARMARLQEENRKADIKRNS
ncbi:MAG TPA: hypothetical protein VNX68_17465, partial [Nitrosopumilaceae archaeon]|nr:hypothetical protein [Nitrosopumilaceae archaeon]